jgi:hypothetical protein
MAEAEAVEPEALEGALAAALAAVDPAALAAVVAAVLGAADPPLLEHAPSTRVATSATDARRLMGESITR